MPKYSILSLILFLSAALSIPSRAQSSSSDSTHFATTSPAPDSTNPFGQQPHTMSSIDRREVPNPLDFITNLPTDWRDWVADNFRLRYWPQISLIAASTALMILYDNQLWTPFEKEYNRNSSFRNTADLFVDVGDGRFQFGLSAAYLAYGVIASDKRAIRCASEITEVILASGGVVQLLKHITGRQSPIDISANPTGVWDWFPNQIDYLHHTSNYDAFPSGHLTTVLATLVVIANNYPEQAWIRPVGYAICTGVAAGLVAQSVHWWSDFPLAIALGIGFGDLLSPNPNADVSVPTKAHETGSLETTISHLLAQTTFAPTYVPDGAGLGMTLRF